MISIFHRFSSAINDCLSFSDSSPPPRLHLSDVRRQLVDALHDCDDRVSQRVAYEIQIASSAQDLWLLRTDIHRCIALAHSQGEASARIDPITASFMGWLPPHQLASAGRPFRASVQPRAS